MSSLLFCTFLRLARQGTCNPFHYFLYFPYKGGKGMGKILQVSLSKFGKYRFLYICKVPMPFFPLVPRSFGSHGIIQFIYRYFGRMSVVRTRDATTAAWLSWPLSRVLCEPSNSWAGWSCLGWVDRLDQPRGAAPGRHTPAQPAPATNNKDRPTRHSLLLTKLTNQVEQNLVDTLLHSLHQQLKIKKDQQGTLYY